MHLLNIPVRGSAHHSPVFLSLRIHFTMTCVGIKFACLTLGLLLFFITRTRTQEIEDETESRYSEGSCGPGINWNFTYINGPCGPENWGNLKQEWRLCETGRNQSPIDVLDSHAQFDPTLEMTRHYSPANAKLVNRGYDIMLSWPEDAGTILIHGKRFTLKQCHWHHPSEHEVDGIRYDLELHMVHQSDDDAIAVVGILYKYGEPDPFLAKFTKQLQSLATQTEEDVGSVDPMEIDADWSKYYRYEGSLTTPPCSEGVIWTIVKRVKTVSPAQVRLLEDAVHDGFEMNARPLQALNGRIVKKFSFSPLITDFTGLVDVD